MQLLPLQTLFELPWALEEWTNLSLIPKVIKDFTVDQTTISNDGATILKLMDIVHPAGKALVDISRAQDAEVGDGTTSVTLFAAELLSEIKQYIEEGVSPQIIINGFRKSSLLVLID
jgi:T-complex protein 1 subunit eta